MFGSAMRFFYTVTISQSIMPQNTRGISQLRYNWGEKNGVPTQTLTNHMYLQTKPPSSSAKLQR
jgi:hypothetical protein